jgi:hypothetical protein
MGFFGYLPLFANYADMGSRDINQRLPLQQAESKPERNGAYMKVVKSKTSSTMFGLNCRISAKALE